LVSTADTSFAYLPGPHSRTPFEMQQRVDFHGHSTVDARFAHREI